MVSWLLVVISVTATNCSEIRPQQHIAQTGIGKKIHCPKYISAMEALKCAEPGCVKILTQKKSVLDT